MFLRAFINILDIRQGPEYPLISACSRVVNVLGFWLCKGYPKLCMKYLIISVWHYDEYALDSEYPRVLNIPVLHSVWESDLLYVCARVLRIHWVINMLGLEFKKAMNMARLKVH